MWQNRRVYPGDNYLDQNYPGDHSQHGGYTQAEYPDNTYRLRREYHPYGAYPPQGGDPTHDRYPPQAQYGYPAEQDFQYSGAPYGQPAVFVLSMESLGEDGDVKGLDFTEKSIRMGFIRKVYAILMCQLLVTMGCIGVFIFHPVVKMWGHANFTLFFILLGVMVVYMLLMVCCESIRRQAPMNVIFLFIFTIALGMLLGMVSAQFEINIVLMAVGITAAISLALTLFAFQTKWDFTVMGGWLFCFLFILIIFGIVYFWIDSVPIMHLVYSSLGALVFSFYLVYDTQMMMGGNHMCSISPEEYIFAAFNLYIDIINIFLYILRIVTKCG